MISGSCLLHRQSMLEFLKELDARLLVAINHSNNHVLDFLFYWISNKWIWIPFYFFLAYRVFKIDGRNGFILMIFVAATIAVCDQLASSFLKNYFMRLRPCHEPGLADQIHLVKDYCGGQYGFVSSHAANVFGLSALLIRIFRGKNLIAGSILWSWATIVSLSRVYLGAHYPGDIVGGAILGVVVGSIFAGVYIQYIQKKKIKN